MHGITMTIKHGGVTQDHAI